MKIIGVGEIVWDCLPGGKKLGGAPVNFAYYAKEMGAQSYPISAVGLDALGKETIETCHSFGLCTDYIQRNDLPTSRVLVSVDNSGVPQYDIVENVAWDALDCTINDISLVHDADCICWGSLAQRCDQSRKSIHELIDHTPADCLKVFDINIRQQFYTRDLVESSLYRTDILKLNEDELPAVLNLTECKNIADLICKYQLRYVIYTCGAFFSEVYSRTGLDSHIETPIVNVADTVGAGDSFTAVFVTRLLEGNDIRTCHEQAVNVSAFVCTQEGAINHIEL